MKENEMTTNEIKSDIIKGDIIKGDIILGELNRITDMLKLKKNQSGWMWASKRIIMEGGRRQLETRRQILRDECEEIAYT